MTQIDEAGTPDPLDFRRHRPMPNPFAAGQSFTNGAAISAYIPVAGALALSLRFKFTGGGTFTFAYVRPAPNSGTAYGVGNPGNVAVVANTEQLVTINPNGEGNLLVTFTPSADGVVTFFDTMQQ